MPPQTTGRIGADTSLICGGAGRRCCGSSQRRGGAGRTTRPRASATCSCCPCSRSWVSRIPRYGEALRDALGEFGWSLFTELGVPGGVRHPQGMALDPEPIGVAAPILFEWDPRLRDQVCGWCAFCFVGEGYREARILQNGGLLARGAATLWRPCAGLRGRGQEADLAGSLRLRREPESRARRAAPARGGTPAGGWGCHRLDSLAGSWMAATKSYLW